MKVNKNDIEEAGTLNSGLKLYLGGANIIKDIIKKYNLKVSDELAKEDSLIIKKGDELVGLYFLTEDDKDVKRFELSDKTKWSGEDNAAIMMNVYCF